MLQYNHLTVANKTKQLLTVSRLTHLMTRDRARDRAIAFLAHTATGL